MANFLTDGGFGPPENDLPYLRDCLGGVNRKLAEAQSELARVRAECAAERDDLQRRGDKLRDAAEAMRKSCAEDCKMGVPCGELDVMNEAATAWPSAPAPGDKAKCGKCGSNERWCAANECPQLGGRGNRDRRPGQCSYFAPSCDSHQPCPDCATGGGA
jgi:hypothetical protein